MAAIIQSISLNKSFGAVVAASNISIDIEEGTITGLIGTNGAGKTTFVNMITGYLKPDTGTIRFRGEDITSLPPRAITRMGVARSFQIPQLFNSLTVRENLAVSIVARVANGLEGLRAADHDTLDSQAAEVLARFGLATSASQRLARCRRASASFLIWPSLWWRSRLFYSSTSRRVASRARRSSP